MFNLSKPEFKGSGVLFLRNVLLYVLVMAPLVSFCLMGGKWAHIFFTMVVLSLPFALLAAFMVSRFDGFSFDDEQQQFLMPARRRVLYQSVTRIDINETGRLLQVGLKQGLLRRASLAYALDKKDKPRLLEELHKRLPQVVMRERRHVDWKSISVILAVIVLMTAGFHLYLYRSYSEFGVVPQQVAWAGTGKKLRNTQQYVVGQFGIVMHKRFQLKGWDEGALQFEDRATKTEIKFMSGPQGSIFPQKAAFLPYATGIHDYYDVLETAYGARVGVVPLVLKMFALLNLTEVSLYEIRQPLSPNSIGEGKQGKEESAAPLSALKGFATQGKKKGQEVVSIVLMDAKRKADIHIFISAPLRLKEKALQEIVTGVSVRPNK